MIPPMAAKAKKASAMIEMEACTGNSHERISGGRGRISREADEDASIRSRTIIEVKVPEFLTVYRQRKERWQQAIDQEKKEIVS